MHLSTTMFYILIIMLYILKQVVNHNTAGTSTTVPLRIFYTLKYTNLFYLYTFFSRSLYLLIKILVQFPLVCYLVALRFRFILFYR